MRSRYYTLIGSRETPKEICDLLTKAASKLCDGGWVVRSGGADGADTCAEDGHNRGVLENANIYLPWEGFNGRSSDQRGYINTPKLKTYNNAMTIASQFHPVWDRLTRGPKALHTRNVYQVLGDTLDKPSSFVLCWAKEDSKGNISGGTATAVKIARHYGIPVYNLYQQDVLERVIKFVEE